MELLAPERKSKIFEQNIQLRKCSFFEKSISKSLRLFVFNSKKGNFATLISVNLQRLSSSVLAFLLQSLSGKEQLISLEPIKHVTDCYSTGLKYYLSFVLEQQILVSSFRSFLMIWLGNFCNFQPAKRKQNKTCLQVFYPDSQLVALKFYVLLQLILQTIHFFLPIREFIPKLTQFFGIGFYF